LIWFSSLDESGCRERMRGIEEWLLFNEKSHGSSLLPSIWPVE
jgi:hypothetical protein